MFGRSRNRKCAGLDGDMTLKEESVIYMTRCKCKREGS